MNISFVDYGSEPIPRPNRNEKGKSYIDFPSSYVVIDIETTGLDPVYCDIIEISALKVVNNTVADKYSALVKPNSYFVLDEDDTTDDYCIVNNNKIQYVDEFITKLTGISNKILESALTIDSVIPQFNEFIGDSILVGHNINFDINFLYDAFEKVLRKPLTNNFIDTMRISRKILHELQHHRLCDIVNYFDLDYKGAHRALVDCELTNICFIKLRELVLSKYTISDFVKLFKSGEKKIDINSITTDISDFDETHPLYNKMCVFTGALSGLVRKDAMQKVVDLGGKVGNNVTKETNFLIIGSFDFIKSVKGNKSSKVKKAEKLIESGQDIYIISENTFMDMLEFN